MSARAAEDNRDNLLAAVTHTLNEAESAERYLDSAHRDAKATVIRARAAYDLVFKLIQDGKVSP